MAFNHHTSAVVRRRRNSFRIPDSNRTQPGKI